MIFMKQIECCHVEKRSCSVEHWCVRLWETLQKWTIHGIVCLYTSTTVKLIAIHFVLCLGGGLGVGSVLLVGQDYIYYTWLVTILYFSVEYLFNKMPSVLWCCWLGGRKGIRPVKNWVVRCWHGYLSGARCCRLAYGQLMPLPLTVSCFSEIQIGFYRAMLHPRY